MVTIQLNSAHLSSFPNAQTTIGRAARAWQDNKYGQAAREIAGLELKIPALTGPPVTGTGFEPGFLDILI